MAFVALFPGQGSQAVGMLSDLAASHPVIQHTFTEASDALGYDLWALAQHGPADQLSLTEITQPLLLTAGVALLRAWTEAGGAAPQYACGHSLGEYSALTAFGAFGLADAVRVVQARGQFMQAAVPAGTGAMAAVLGLDDAVIEGICLEVAAELGDVVEAVNYNAPGQLVIAGHQRAVEAALPRLKAVGAKRALPLPVSAPFHCALMRPAAERLADVLAEVPLQSPTVPVIQNVSMRPETDPEQIRSQLITQTFSPVRWTQTIQGLQALGVKVAAEFGPGAVLCGLAKRIETEVAHAPLGTVAQFDHALQQVGDIA